MNKVEKDGKTKTIFGDIYPLGDSDINSGKQKRAPYFQTELSRETAILINYESKKSCLLTIILAIQSDLVQSK